MRDDGGTQPRVQDGPVRGKIAAVTAKGQITIAKQILDTLAVGRGDQLLFVAGAGLVVLVPLRPRPLSWLGKALAATQRFRRHQSTRQQIRTDLGERIAGGDEWDGSTFVPL